VFGAQNAMLGDMDDVNQTSGPFGSLLRMWRRQRRLSQMALANSANTTPRHVSFLETGRSRPGRALVLRLSEALNVPLRDQNDLLRAAGFGPAYADHAAPGLDGHPLRAAIQDIVNRHNPYPAAVIDPLGKIILANAAFHAFAPGMADLEPEQSTEMMFAQGAGEAMFANWNHIAWAWIARNRRELAERPSPRLAAIIERAIDLLGDEPAPPQRGDPYPDVISPILRIGDQLIRTYTMVMRFEAPQDVALSELRIELVFPYDDAGRAFFNSLNKA